MRIMPARPKPPSSKRPPGRPPSDTAKSRDPDYRATTIYVRREQYADAKNILFRRGEDFSDLVGAWLEAWLREQAKKRL
jgi:hypothetical protein